jgi:hypothetical protein
MFGNGVSRPVPERFPVKRLQVNRLKWYCGNALLQQRLNHGIAIGLRELSAAGLYTNQLISSPGAGAGVMTSGTRSFRISV